MIDFFFYLAVPEPCLWTGCSFSKLLRLKFGWLFRCLLTNDDLEQLFYKYARKKELNTQS